MCEHAQMHNERVHICTLFIFNKYEYMKGDRLYEYIQHSSSNNYV